VLATALLGVAMVDADVPQNAAYRDPDQDLFIVSG
jgi:hypothetical protein